MSKVARLLDAIQPTRYQLTLEPDLETFTFRGSETIEFEHLADSKSLTLHSLELDISRPLVHVNGRRLAPTNVSYHKTNQTVTFHCDETIPAGPLRLQVEFVGKLRDELHGFYRSRYDVNGQSHWMATTQFEATYAREAFICIDEPSAKAVFETTLIVPGKLTAVSNTNVVSQKERADGKQVVRFAPTPKMSSYLLAFLVGQLEAAETTNAKGTLVRVLTTPGKQRQAGFALDVAARTLAFYTDYFGIAYPLPKLDMIAVPDFMIGAMENWGAVTYRETAILVDPDASALLNKQYVAMVVAHELAHQWFGNLVTMSWWTDLWLNESFASWVEYLAVDHLFPEWNMWTQFVSNDYQVARALDGLANTHPIEVEVEDPAEISEIFDAISYQKGASVIRMLHHYIGEEPFKRGLHNYLKAFGYANATTADLWHHLEESSGKPVKQLMSAWTAQPGFPVVEVHSTRSGAQLEQRRFYANPQETAKAKEAQLWPIPVQATTSSGHPDQILFDTATTGYKLPTNSWFKLNPGQTGFYVTQYEPAALARLQAPLAAAELPPADRLGLTSDAFTLTSAGRLGSDQVLALTRALRAETDYSVWMSLFDGLGNLFVITADDDLYRRLERFSLWLVQPGLERLDWQGSADESHFDRLLRPMMLRWAGRLGDEAVLAEARQRLAGHLEGQPIQPDLRAAVYATVARHGGADEYDQLRRLYREADLQEEQRRLLGALAQFQDDKLLTRTLELAVSEEVRSQDSLFGILSVLGNRRGRRQAWRFIQDRWPLLVERYAQGHMMSRIPEGLGSVFASAEVADEIERFFAKHPVPSIARTVKQCLEQIRLQADWYQRDKAKIKTFLDEFKPE
ncbi:M1 family metallopeptidase [Candidatus Parcubacteria bacterium]|nr:M1 family metallopeptidase [Candidatus Parcubacteria bacterium]